MASASREGTPEPRGNNGRTGQPRKRKPHRKGSSHVDARTGAVRLNNAKPARQQLPGAEISGEATYVADGVRLQKVLAQAGVASRRGAEELIAAGRVSVDGEVVTEQGMRVDPATAIVRVDGERIEIADDMVYLALNKPAGMHTTMVDDFGRPCVGDLVAERVMAGQRLFHVGRLDAETEGLLFLTNDGELAHRLMHPSFRVAKTYIASVRGVMPRSVGRDLRQGITLDDGPVALDGFKLIDVVDGITMVEVTLHEGRKRIVRRLFDAVGFPVVRLVRTDIGSVSLGNQRPGTLRVMDKKEITALYKEVGL